MVLEIYNVLISKIRSFIETQNNAENNQSNDRDDEQNSHPPAIND